MVGNDIVDVNEAKRASNWQRPRFLEKLFTQLEQHMIDNAPNASHMVWRLWSMKEAAYKLYVQMYPSRFYNPKGFECSLEGHLGTVKFRDFKCSVETKITTNYILSEARLCKKEMTSKVITFKNNQTKEQSALIRKEVLKALSNTFDIPTEHLEIGTSAYNIPFVHFNSKKVPLSLTHHGNFGAYALY